MQVTRETSGLTVITAGGFAVASASSLPVSLQNVFASQGLKETELLHLSYPLVHEGVNGNGDEFCKAEMLMSYPSLVGTVLDKDHSQSIDSIVGKHYDARYAEEHGMSVIYCDAYIYANLYPDVAMKLKDGTINGVSMEARFEWAERSTDKRTLHAITFIGAGLVRTPADSKARVSLKTTTAIASNRREIAIAVATALLSKEI